MRQAALEKIRASHKEESAAGADEAGVDGQALEGEEEEHLEDDANDED